MPIIGTGGVRTGRDALEFLLAGAAMVAKAKHWRQRSERGGGERTGGVADGGLEGWDRGEDSSVAKGPEGLDVGCKDVGERHEGRGVTDNLKAEVNEQAYITRRHNLNASRNIERDEDDPVGRRRHSCLDVLRLFRSV